MKRAAMALTAAVVCAGAGVAFGSPQSSDNPSVTLDITPDDGQNLPSPAALQATGAGFASGGFGVSGNLMECTHDVATNFDVCSSPLARFTSDSSGNFTQTVQVTKTFQGTDAANQPVTVNCEVVQCFVRAESDSGQFAADHTISFAPTPPPPTCDGRNATIVGTAGADTIEGTGAADVIVAGDGDDVVTGLGGDDVICGGLGDDQIRGGDGNDRALGDVGADQVMGDQGNDTLSGNANDDQLSGGAGDDRITGGGGNDQVAGGDGNDRVHGDPGADQVAGNAGNDFVAGGGGDDQCAGGAGTDTQADCEAVSTVP